MIIHSYDDVNNNKAVILALYENIRLITLTRMNFCKLKTQCFGKMQNLVRDFMKYQTSQQSNRYTLEGLDLFLILAN